MLIIAIYIVHGLFFNPVAIPRFKEITGVLLTIHFALLLNEALPFGIERRFERLMGFAQSFQHAWVVHCA